MSKKTADLQEYKDKILKTHECHPLMAKTVESAVIETRDAKKIHFHSDKACDTFQRALKKADIFVLGQLMEMTDVEAEKYFCIKSSKNKNESFSYDEYDEKGLTFSWHRLSIS